MKLPEPAGDTAVILTATAAGLAGTLQLEAEPPCAVNAPELNQTLKSRDEFVPIGPPALRVSTTRHGVTGVYTRSSPVSPSALVSRGFSLAGGPPKNELATTLRNPSSEPATLAARR